MSDTLTTQSATPATIPASTVIATDDAGASGHVQIVKLALSADGSATPITADANGMEVQGAGTAGTPAGGVMSVQGVASGTALPVSAASLPLPFGASTLAEQQSQTTHLATIAGDTTDIETAVELLDDAVATTGSAIPSKGFAVSGTDGTNARILKTDSSGELQVDVLSMPTTTVQGTVTANAGSGPFPVSDNGGALTVDNAGTFAVQVDGSALTALQLIDNLVLAEDAAHVSGDPGVQALAVRKDSGASIAQSDGDYSPLQLDSSGNLRVNVAAGGAGDGAILDGASASIKATVLDYTNSNPLAVRLSDTNGDYVAAGAGTQYTEDAAAAANPVGSALIMVRDDALSGQTSDDGDNVAARGTDKGELYVKHVDAIPVTDNGGALTVDGTVGISGTVTVDGSGSTQPISHAALTELAAAIDTEVQVDVVGALPAGDNNIGNVDVVTLPALPAGTNNIGDVDVLSVVPGTSATSLGKAEDAAHTTGDTGVMALAVRADTAAATGADGDYVPLLTDSAGKLHVNVGNTVTVASHAVTNAGTFAVQVDGNALTALQLIDDPVVQDDAAFTPGTTKVSMAGFQADESSTDSVDEGDGGAARMTLDRKIIITPQPHTQGGLSIFRSLDLDESEEQVKATAGQVYGVWFTNTATTTRWLKFYNDTAANVTVGSTTPVITLALPGNSSDDISGVFGMTHGIAFDTAITVACTTGVADADTGAPSANDCIVNVFYK